MAAQLPQQIGGRCFSGAPTVDVMALAADAAADQFVSAGAQSLQSGWQGINAPTRAGLQFGSLTSFRHVRHQPVGMVAGPARGAGLLWCRWGERRCRCGPRQVGRRRWRLVAEPLPAATATTVSSVTSVPGSGASAVGSGAGMMGPSPGRTPCAAASPAIGRPGR